MADLHSGYMTSRQLKLWEMLREGLTQSAVARRLGVSRQAVSKLAQTIPDRVTAALNDAAKLNRVEPKHIDVSRGILLGWSEDLQTETVVVLNPGGGLRIWYQHSLGKCKICKDEKECRSMLFKTAEALEVPLAETEKRFSPSDLSGFIFSRILGNKTKASCLD